MAISHPAEFTGMYRALQRLVKAGSQLTTTLAKSAFQKKIESELPRLLLRALASGQPELPRPAPRNRSAAVNHALDYIMEFADEAPTVMGREIKLRGQADSDLLLSPNFGLG